MSCSISSSNVPRSCNCLTFRIGPKGSRFTSAANPASLHSTNAAWSRRPTKKIDGEIVGTVGVIGPTRMAYERVIPIVDITAKLLSSALTYKHGA